MSRQPARFIQLAAFVFGVMVPIKGAAVLYTVDGSFSDTGSAVTLTGTVDIPLGSYTIQNKGPCPFTSVDLTLTANGYVFDLNEADSDFIYGTGQFFIDATPTSLIFNTANANGSNPADLQFIVSTATPPYLRNFYGIGSDDAPGFEAALVPGADLDADIALPVVFGTVSPEPSTCSVAVLGVLTLVFRRCRNRKGGGQRGIYRP